MEIHVDYSDGRAEMSFIPVDFYALESIFGRMPIRRIEKFNLGVFPDDDPENDLYLDEKDLHGIFPIPPENLMPLFDFLRRYGDRESFSVYKLGIDFGRFRILYDDDSYLSITGDMASKADFETLDALCRKVCATIGF